MKKLIFTLITVFALSINSFANETGNPTNTINEELCNEATVGNDTDDRLTFDIHVEWGRRSKDCKGFGVCSVTVTIEWSLASFSATSDTNSSTGAQVLKLSLTEDNARAIERHFGRRAIIVEEAFEINDAQTLRSMGYSRPFVIAPGTYPIQENTIVINSSNR